MQRAAIDKLRRDAFKDTRRVRRSLSIKIDTTVEGGAFKRPDGAWEFDGVATRGDAVFDYSADAGKPWREYRPLAEVGAANSINSLVGAEITDDHPDNFVDPDNARELGRGTVMKAWMDGTLMRVRVIVRDAELLAKIFAGKQELSCGYTAVIVDQAGEHPTEGPYEAIQTQIIHNHLAVVDLARAGPVARLVVPPVAAGAAPAGDRRPDTSKGRDNMNEIVINGTTFAVDPAATTVPATVAEAYAQQQQQLAAVQTELAALKAQTAAPAAAAPGTTPTQPAPVAALPVPPSEDAKGKNTAAAGQDGKGDGKSKAPVIPAPTKDSPTMNTPAVPLTEAQVQAMLDKRDAENAAKAATAKADADKAAARARIIADATPHLPASYAHKDKSEAQILADAVVALDKQAEGYARQLADAGNVAGLEVLLRTKIDAKGADSARVTGQILALAAGGSPTAGADAAKRAMNDRKLGRKPEPKQTAAAAGGGQ